MLARELADRWLQPRMARFVAWVSLSITSGLAALMFATTNQGQTALGSSLGNDYAEFYVAGEILNQGEDSRLYDLEHQDERLHRLLPRLSKEEHLPFVYPPFLALVFRPLAKLPFTGSVATWLGITVGLYSLGIGLTLRSTEAIPAREQTTSWLLALAFPPFAMECCLGGQISAIGALVVAAGLVLARSGQALASGLAFSLLLYKPTLLILIVPMLVVGRVWRILFGFLIGSVILSWLSWGVVGRSGCLDFLGLMMGYGRSGGSIGQGFKTIKYVDFTAFLRLLGVDRSWGRPLAVGFALPIGFLLIGAWSKTRRGIVADRLWASTLCLTPILNLYGPIYDVAVVVPGLLVGTNAILRESSGVWSVQLRWLLAFLFLSAMTTQPLAQRIGFQPLTLGLLASGLFFLIPVRQHRSGITRTPSELPDITTH